MEVTPAEPGTPWAFGAEREDFRDPHLLLNGLDTGKQRDMPEALPALKRHSPKEDGKGRITAGILCQ